MSPKKVSPILVINYSVIGKGTDEILNDINVFKGILEDSGINEEYYTFILPVNIKDSYIQVFYEKDFTETKYEELKEIINNKLKENNIVSASFKFENGISNV